MLDCLPVPTAGPSTVRARVLERTAEPTATANQGRAVLFSFSFFFLPEKERGTPLSAGSIRPKAAGSSASKCIAASLRKAVL